MADEPVRGARRATRRAPPERQRRAASRRDRRNAPERDDVRDDAPANARDSDPDEARYDDPDEARYDDPDDDRDDDPDDRDRTRGDGRISGRDARRIRSAGDAARIAIREIGALTGRRAENVVSIEKREDGWRVGVEVVETRRIPDSADILAAYQIELDPYGDLVSYRRTGRYLRGRMEGR